MLDRTFKSYKNQIPYPDKNKLTMAHIYYNGAIIASKLKSDLTKDDKKLTIQYNVLPEYKTLLKQYNDGASIAMSRFMYDLFGEYGVQNNPKREKCFDLAWEKGHHAGLYEVANQFEELQELISE